MNRCRWRLPFGSAFAVRGQTGARCGVGRGGRRKSRSDRKGGVETLTAAACRNSARAAFAPDPDPSGAARFLRLWRLAAARPDRTALDMEGYGDRLVGGAG